MQYINLDGRVTATALFNRLNGLFITVLAMSIEDSQYDKTLYEGREVEFDFNRDVLVGGLTVNDDGTFTDNFEVVAADSQQEVIYERMLNLQAEQKITKQYPIVDQVNILTKAIQRLGKELDLNDTDEFKALSEMTSYVAQVIQANKARKVFYSENPDVKYVTDEEYAAQQAARLDGGIHEAIGARGITGGRIFGTEGV